MKNPILSIYYILEYQIRNENIFSADGRSVKDMRQGRRIYWLPNK